MQCRVHLILSDHSNMEFYVLENLDFDKDEQLQLECTGKGRLGAVLVDIETDAKVIPLVRTTTNYKCPLQRFTTAHYKLIEAIQKSRPNLDLHFNNAMVELYDASYKTMGFHSDQSQDLADNSYIAIYSRYSAQGIGIRTLILQNKETGEESSIPMKHNLVILFSVATNTKFRHKIVLESKSTNTDEWLGITLRCSKTFISQHLLHLANEEERQSIYKLKSRENREVGIVWPTLDYTLSEGDLLAIR